MDSCPRQPGQSRRWSPTALALALSLALHAAGGLATGRFGVGRADLPGLDRAQAWQAAGSMLLEFPPDEAAPPETLAALPPPPPPILPPEPVPEPEPPAVTLGIERSDLLSENMLGFADPTEHQAPMVGFDQPALDPSPGAAPSAAAAPGMPDARPEPGEGGEFPPELTPPAPPAPPAPLPVEAREAVEAVTPRTAPESTPLREGLPSEPAIDRRVPDPRAALAELSRDLVEAVEAALAVLPSPPPPPAGPPRPLPGPRAPTGTPGERGDSSAPAPARPATPGLPALASDKESDPGAKAEPIVIRPGRPAAAEGLEIETRRIEFSKLTRITVWPSADPVVEITFARDGRASNVRLVVSSGSLEVDEPVINAAFNWRARGPRLAQLTASGPHSGVSHRFRIVLR